MWAHKVFHCTFTLLTATDTNFERLFLFWLSRGLLECFGEEGAAKPLVTSFLFFKMGSVEWAPNSVNYWEVSGFVSLLLRYVGSNSNGKYSCKDCSRVFAGECVCWDSNWAQSTIKPIAEGEGWSSNTELWDWHILGLYVRGEVGVSFHLMYEVQILVPLYLYISFPPSWGLERLLVRSSFYTTAQ